eukprot:GHVS01045504.1.p1 GENE.GHVS01045504.1~~GHVS01045504.1.p1  ORF type:complete len:276 (+),score=34.07 GHVS01045504.1:295-1122(+)
MGNLCQKHTTSPSPVSFSSAVVPTPTSNMIPTSHGSSPSPIPSGSFGCGTAQNGSSQGDDVGDGIGSLTVEHSSTSGYPVSFTTLSVTSESTRTYSPSTKCRNASGEGPPEPIQQPNCSSAVTPTGQTPSAQPTTTTAVTPSNKAETQRSPSTAPLKSLSSVSLEPADQHRLRHFYARNLRAQKRHATVMAQQRMSLHTCDTSSTSSDRVDVYDVFSPDERSTRWSEFQELLANSTQEYNSYKIATKNVRGSNKAMTIAGVRPNPNPSAQLPIMH